MFPTQKTEITRLGIETDEASFSRLEQRLNVLGDKLLILQRTNEAFARSSAMTGESIHAAFQKAGDQVSRLTQIMEAAKSRAAGNYNALRNELMPSDSGGGGASQASSGGLRIEGLRRAGGALSQLGMSEAGGAIMRIGDVAQIGKEFQQVTKALGPLGTAIVGVGAVSVAASLSIDQMNRNLEPTAKLLTQATAQLDAYYNAIEQGTTESLQKQIQADKVKKALVDAEIAQIQGAQDKAFKSAQGYGGDALARVEFALAGTNPEFQKTIQHLDELKTQSAALGGKIAGTSAAMESAGVAANDAAEAERQLQQARDAGIDKAVSRATRNAQLLESGSSKSIESTLVGIRAEKDAIGRTLRMGAGQSDEEAKKLNARYAELMEDEKDLTENILPLIRAREREAEAAKKTEEAVKAAEDEVTRSNQDTLSAYKRHNQAVASIEQNDLDARANIQQKYNDALVKAAEDAVQAAENALQKLEEQRQNLSDGLARDLAKADRDAADRTLETQIKAQRQERDDLVAHLRRLQEIRNSSQAEEQQAVWDRNALQLIQLRLQKSQQMEAENTSYAQKKQDAQRQATDEHADQVRQQAAARRERLLAYQQANADANAQYQRELAQAAQAKQKALALAAKAEATELQQQAAKLRKALDLENEQARAEVKLAQTVGDARIKLLQAEMDVALKWAAQINGTSGGSTAGGAGSSGGGGRSATVRTRAGGGTAMPGMIYQVNEEGTESFNGVSFPPGLGLFMPAQAGSIRASQTTINRGAPVINITVNEAENGIRTQQMVRTEIDAAMDKVFGK